MADRLNALVRQKARWLTLPQVVPRPAALLRLNNGAFNVFKHCPFNHFKTILKDMQKHKLATGLFWVALQFQSRGFIFSASPNLYSNIYTSR